MASVNNTSSSSNVAYSYLQYKNKIGGLVSGMDIDSIMEKLMKAESAQMEKLQQQKQKYEWKRDAYREVNTTLTSFEQGIFDNYGKPSNWAAKTVSNSDSSKIAVTAGASAVGSLSISVDKIATSASLTTTMQSGITAKTTIAELGGEFANGGSFIVSSLTEDGTMDSGVTITYSATDKISDILNRISQKTGVSAISLGDKVSFTNKNTGQANTSMDVSGDTNGLFSKLGLEQLDDGSGVATGYYNFDSQSGFKVGENASYNVNGIQQTEKASNKFSVSGYNIELKAPTTSTVSISSTTETDKIVDKVKEFVETYNGLIKDLNTRVSEKKNVDYSPLTDAQKAEMTEAEITKWEEKAKAGTLKGDSSINTALSSMRSTISSFGNGTQDMLYKIGITTSSVWSENGKLQVDEDKLRAAIESDPDIVSRIFTGDASSGSKGIVNELRTATKTAVSNIEQTAGKASSTEKSYSLGKTISDLDTKISDWKDRLKDIEERYWNQFSAMETAIQKANSQSSIFSS